MRGGPPELELGVEGDAEAVLLVLLVHALVGVALGVAVLVRLLLLPLAVAVLQAVQELARVARPVLPLVLTETLWLAGRVLANVAVAICEEV